MNPHPIGLTQDQLTTVLDAADQLPAQWRSRFLETVVDQLLPLSRVDDADVQRACAAVLRRVGVAT